MNWKITPLAAASLFALSAFAIDDYHKPDRTEGLLVDHDTATEKCGVGNYLFRYLKDGCNPTTASSEWMEYDTTAMYPIIDDSTRTTASSSTAEATTSENRVYYPLGVYTLSDDRKDELDQTAQFLKDNPNASVDVLGYADATGGVSVSEKVARERARKARDYLMAQGVSSSQIHVVTPADPVSENMDNALDRRTELRVQTLAE